MLRTIINTKLLIGTNGHWSPGNRDYYSSATFNTNFIRVVFETLYSTRLIFVPSPFSRFNLFCFQNTFSHFPDCGNLMWHDISDKKIPFRQDFMCIIVCVWSYIKWSCVYNHISNAYFVWQNIFLTKFGFIIQWRVSYVYFRVTKRPRIMRTVLEFRLMSSKN